MDLTDTGIALRCTCSACPVQYEGTVDGYPAYWRARYDSFTLAIATTPGTDPVEVGCGMVAGWAEERAYGAPGGFDAGYIPHAQAEQLIREGVAAFRASQQKEGTR
jgi:hypothetical protein